MRDAAGTGALSATTLLSHVHNKIARVGHAALLSKTGRTVWLAGILSVGKG